MSEPMYTPLKLIDGAAPNMKGIMGQAWLVSRADMREGVARNPGCMDDRFTACLYVVHAPFAHPFFHHYQITCVSLRSDMGTPSARIHLEGATHEIQVMVMHPDTPKYLNAANQLLTPPNFIGQFIAASDEAAAARVRVTVQEIVQGQLYPDTDHQYAWVKRYGDHCLKKR